MLSDGLFSADDLDSFAELSDSYLPDRCTISGQVTATSSSGGHTLTYVDVATDVPCRVAAIAGLRGALAAREVGFLIPQALYVVVLRRDIEVDSPARQIRLTDRIIVTAASDAAIHAAVAERPLNIEFIDDMLTSRVQTRLFCANKALGSGGVRP